MAGLHQYLKHQHFDEIENDDPTKRYSFEKPWVPLGRIFLEVSCILTLLTLPLTLPFVCTVSSSSSYDFF